MSAVDPRYAEALLSLTSDLEEADQVGLILADFSAALLCEEELRSIMLNPSVSRNIKKETIGKLLEGRPYRIVLVESFLLLLVDKDRLSDLPRIYEEYERLKAKRRSILHLIVFSAQPLDENQLEAIREKYTKAYGAVSARMETKIDPALLGGVCVQIGDIRIDDTLLGRLKGLSSRLAEA